MQKDPSKIVCHDGGGGGGSFDRVSCLEYNILEFKLHGNNFYVGLSRQKADGSMNMAILKLPSKCGFSFIYIKIRIDGRIFLIATNTILE